MKFKIPFKGKDYEIKIEETEKGTRIEVGEKEFFFEEEKKTLLPKSFEKRDFLEKKFLAPIAGTISEIFVQEGEIVERGQKILILSAMKMENEIVAEVKGKVKKIFVKKGEVVKKGDQLFILE